MKFKEILNILPKYNDNSGYDINIKNINIPDYQNNNINMYNWEIGKQEFSNKILKNILKKLLTNGIKYVSMYILRTANKNIKI